jgi:hypothetical protein
MDRTRQKKTYKKATEKKTWHNIKKTKMDLKFYHLRNIT